MASPADPLGAATAEAAQQAQRHCAARRALYIERLAALVNLDSGPDTRDGRDGAAELLGGWARGSGLDVEMIDGAPGLTVHAVLHGELPARVVLLGHHDTVFPLGTATSRPLSTSDQVAHGPGTADMKGGLLVALAVQEALVAGGRPTPTVELLSVPDEEVRKVPFATLDRVRGAAAVLVFECGREDGDFVAARKTGAWAKVSAHGRPAHAGTEPDRGRNSILGLCHETLRCARLSGSRPGLTVTAGTISGGSIPNVVPEDAEAVFDLRAATSGDLDWAIAQMASFARHNGVSFALDLVGRWPGIEPTDAGDTLAEIASTLSAAFGPPVHGQTTGGMSDGCWTAAEGIPTLDGLGPVGGNDHSPDEYIDLGSVAPRCGIAAGLVSAIGGGALESPRAAKT